MVKTFNRFYPQTSQITKEPPFRMQNEINFRQRATATAGKKTQSTT